MSVFTVATSGATPAGNSASLQGSWSNNAPGNGALVWFDSGIGSLTDSSAQVSPGTDPAGSYAVTISTAFDRTYQYKAKGTSVDGGTGGATLTFLSFAQAPIFGTPSASSITATTAVASCSVTPNVVESSSTTYVEFRVTGSGSAFTRQTSTTITGLTGGTTYDLRFSVDRTTTNVTNATSSTVTFTTRASPTTTTGAASAITATTATVAGVVNAVSSENSVSYFFEYGLTTAFGSSTTIQGPTSSTVNIPYTADLISLTPGATYYYRAKGTTSEQTVTGTTGTFTTVNATSFIMGL